jgi:tetratricopeptide (TPR) repeat protein
MMQRKAIRFFCSMWVFCLGMTAAWAQDDQVARRLNRTLDDQSSPTVSEEYSAFLKLLRSKDTAAQRKFLAQWEGIGQEDPELYVCYANYYTNLAKKEVIKMTTVPPQPGEESFAINDSLGNVVGYLRGETVMDDVLSAQSLMWLNKGIARFPRRLDLLFGKVYLFGKMVRYDSFSTTILSAIEKSVDNQFEWQWSKGVELQDGKQFLFSTCQDYIAQLFNSEDSLALLWIEPISLALLEIDPKNVPCTSNLAVANMMLQRWEEALIHLAKAHALDPKDDVVLANMGYCNLQLRNKAQAKKFYNLLKKSAEPEYQKLAKEMLQLVKQLK